MSAYKELEAKWWRSGVINELTSCEELIVNSTNSTLKEKERAAEELTTLRADLTQAVRHLEYIVCHGYMPDGGIDKLLEKYLDLEEEK
ncbi:MAG TPA: hypothetical protein DCR43_02890 [Bacteroidales bacterium]|nr:hypothetical protein [Bacteroidales bacterium]